MRKWHIVLTKTAEKELSKLNPQHQSLIAGYLFEILKLEHPKLLGKALSANKKGLWRYRVEKFRIICKLEKDELVILVIKIAKRDVVYAD